MSNATSENGKAADHAEYGKKPDIAFVFPKQGGAIIKAEKFKLALKSDVMKKQFTFSQNPDEKLEEIKITDIPSDTFHEMIKHIYGYSIKIHQENYAYLFYASRKYFVDDLTGKVIEFLEKFLNGDNLVDNFDFFEKYQVKMVDELMRDICLLHPQKVIRNLTDPVSHKRILQNILESPNLWCSEFQLYEAVVGMLKKFESDKFGCPRKALGNLFYLIRFPTMSVTELIACGKKPSLLTSDELNDFLQWAQYKTYSNTLQFYSRVPRFQPFLHNGYLRIIRK